MMVSIADDVIWLTQAGANNRYHTDRVNIVKRIYAAVENKQSSITIGPTIDKALLNELSTKFLVEHNPNKPGHYLLHFKPPLRLSKL